MLDERILFVLREDGGWLTAAEIAERLDMKPRSVATSLSWLRGNRRVVDNSKFKIVGKIGSVTSPKGPLKWRIPTPEDRAQFEEWDRTAKTLVGIASD